MISLNKAFFIGNMTRDPELRNIGSTQKCSFGIAVNEQWKARDGSMAEEVMFLDVEVWGDQAARIAEWGRKGRLVFTEGSLKFDRWEKDGQHCQKHFMKAHKVQFLDRRDDSPPVKKQEPEPSYQDAPF